MAENALKQEKSPYLRQHRNDPVHWYTWSPAAFKAAKKDNKPILLSVGYSACHWCHVMADESFSDPQTAELMNRFFVNIKVDKEERPDVDALYQEALHLFGGQGGWPLTMFLTPDSKPFFAGTYFPAEEKPGLPSFREVLWQLANLWRQSPEEAISRSREVYENLQTLATSRSGPESLPQERIDELAQGLCPFLDADHGGFGHGAKFPHTLPLELMWQSWHHGREEEKQRRVLAAGVRLSLDRMCQGGLFDHLRGGFYRYCVDRQWHTPHFEKMLTDNAQMLHLLTLVWCDTRNPLYKDRAEKTADWMLREMRPGSDNENGRNGFTTALDADTPAGEGRFYLWTPSEIRAVLGQDAEKFMAAYGVDKDDSTPQHLTRSHVTAWQADDETGLAATREKLFSAQNSRPAPARDDKILADGNGLAIAALARAAMVFETPRWLTAAREAFEFILKTHSGHEGGLYHSWCDGTVKKVSFAEDYAAMAHAALALYEVTGARTYLEKAQGWMYRLMARHEDLREGGFYRTEKDNHDLLTPLKNSRDGATPSANGLAMQVLARLFHLTGSHVWREQAMRVFGAFSGDATDEIFAHTSLLYGQSLLENPTLITLLLEQPEEVMHDAQNDGDNTGDNAGDSAGKGAAMRRVAHSAPQPNKVVLPLTPADVATLSASHPAAGLSGEQNLPVALVCQGRSCKKPAQDAEALAQVLSEIAEN